jgi:hypothetical protein
MRKLFLILPVIFLFASRAFPQTEIAVDCAGSWGPGRFSKVKINISFDRSDGFARFTQDLPVGFVIVKDVIQEGDFSWNGSQLNVVWMRIPESGKTSFSYFIKPDNQMQGLIDFGGRIVTVTGENSKETLMINEKQITIGGTGGLLPDEMNKSISAVNGTMEIQEAEKVQNTISPSVSGTVYRVQIATSSKVMSGDAMKKKLGIVSKEKMSVVKSGEIFKYQIGEFRDKDSAAAFQKQLVSKGIKDAFVISAR